MTLHEWLNIVFKIMLCVILMLVITLLHINHERIAALESVQQEICLFYDEQELNWIEE
jgi:hypothetical protein